MGGYGSGGGGHALKYTVEDSLVLDLNFILRKEHGGITPRTSMLRWLRNDELVSSLEYRIIDSLGRTILELAYKHNGESIRERIELFCTPQPYGNVRWWMRCPILLGNGKTCNRRCYKMYLPPGQKYFGCRTCMRLTYQSSKDSHKFDRLYAQLGAGIGMSLSEVRSLMR